MAEKPRIIFLDDNPDVIEGYKRVLRKKQADWDILFFTSASNAIEEYGEDSSAILVTDAYMPGLNGLDVLRIAEDINTFSARNLCLGNS